MLSSTDVARTAVFRDLGLRVARKLWWVRASPAPSPITRPLRSRAYSLSLHRTHSLGLSPDRPIISPGSKLAGPIAVFVRTELLSSSHSVSVARSNLHQLMISFPCALIEAHLGDPSQMLRSAIISKIFSTRHAVLVRIWCRATIHPSGGNFILI
jgi:hypothetical protein